MILRVAGLKSFSPFLLPWTWCQRKGCYPVRTIYSKYASYMWMRGLDNATHENYRAVGDDLWEKVKERGVMSQRFCLHIGKRVLDIRQKSSSLLKTEPSCLINRYSISMANLFLAAYLS